MKRWVSCPAKVTYLFIIPGQYEKCVAVLWFLFELHKFFCGSCMFAADCFCTFFYALGAPPTLCCFAFWRPSFLGLSFILCVLGIRSTGLPSSWGDNPGSISYSIYLTKWVTHDPSTAVRATTSLRGERAHLTMLILSPPNGFLSRSLFHNSPLSRGERMC